MSSIGFGIVAVLAVLLTLGALGSVALLLLRARGQARMAERLEPVATASDEFNSGSAPSWMSQLARSGKTLEGWVDTENESARLLVQAGWRNSESRLFWYVFQALVPVAGALAVLAFWAWGPDKNKPMMLLAYGFAAVALSVLLPRWILRGVAGRRRARIKSEVPLFIHLLVLLFEAGLSTRQALASLVREGGGVLPELGREFELVLRQLDAGADANDALKNLGEALEIDDLSSVLSVLRQVDRYGGEVREPLLETLGVLEERRGLDLREQVNLLSGRMTVVMVLFFFPALLIFVAGPAFISVIKVLGEFSGGK